MPDPTTQLITPNLGLCSWLREEFPLIRRISLDSSLLKDTKEGLWIEFHSPFCIALYTGFLLLHVKNGRDLMTFAVVSGDYL